jgi:hypothetical protein
MLLDSDSTLCKMYCEIIRANNRYILLGYSEIFASPRVWRHKQQACCSQTMYLLGYTTYILWCSGMLLNEQTLKKTLLDFKLFIKKLEKERNSLRAKHTVKIVDKCALGVFQSVVRYIVSFNIKHAS